MIGVFVFQAEDGIRDLVRSRGLGDVYKRQDQANAQRVTSRLSFLQGEVTKVESLRSRLDDVLVLSLIHI